MKANELMIGDWVRLRYKRSDMAEVVKDFQVSELRRFYKESPYIEAWSKESGNMGDVEKLEPISLTSEILEKNGFVKVRDFIWEIREQNTCIKYNWHGKIMIEITNTLSKKDERGRCNIAAYTIGWLDDMFVHQLQHALKLCGIEKEITL